VRSAEGKTLLDELGALARRFGLFVSGQKAITMPGADGLAQIGAIMRRLRETPPREIAGLEVTAVGDYQTQVRTAKDGSTTAIKLPRSNVLAFHLAGDNRIIARPSGTEPKIKFYFDLCEPMRAGEEVAAAEARAAQKMSAIEAAFVQAALASG
jgi:phosphomannomutase